MIGRHSILLLLSCVIIFVSCSENEDEIEVKTLTYQLEVEILADTLSPTEMDYYAHRYGDRLNMSINKNGSIRFDYFGSCSNGFEFGLYNIVNNHYYIKWRHMDTIYHYNVNSNAINIKSKKHLPNQKVNGIDCKVLEFIGFEEGNPDYFVNQTYYYNEDTLQINPKKYKDYKEFFFNEYLTESECLYVKKVVEMPEFRLTYTLSHINNKNSMKANKFATPTNEKLKAF